MNYLKDDFVINISEDEVNAFDENDKMSNKYFVINFVNDIHTSREHI